MRYVPSPQSRSRAIKRVTRTVEIDRKSLQRQAVRDRLVMEHLGLVRSIALRVRETLPVHVELDDLIHSGILGLMDAAARFDADKQVSFAGYAKFRIRGAVLDSLRELDWASRDLRRRSRELDTAVHELVGELGRNPTEDELSARLGLPVTATRNLLHELHSAATVSADSRTSGSADLPMPDYASSPELMPDRIFRHQESRGALQWAMQALPPRYREVLVQYYENDLTMKEIGAQLGINESRVSQIHKAALEKMSSALSAAGIRSSAAF
ncbi:MAG TPA: FliA/WhiG family RNA polymerase sigma factor [Bryobacteraceae bacterium]|nr:FliA/WhiG family RNA polymerase sigma factor [Bryobacteraceae bacterium]